MKRRTFIKNAGLSAGALAAMPYVSGPWFRGPESQETGVVIYGGGTSGICAGIQAARLGAEVVVLEATPWIGGMLTAAGVSAMDGNEYAAGGGLVRELRERLAAHYGSMDVLFSGWVSRYCFEPRVGLGILEELAAPLDNLTVWHGAEATGYARAGADRRRVGVTFADGRAAELACSVFIDATEYGDGLALAGIPYRLGRESRSELGESAAPPVPDLEMQDLTYVATLQKQPGAADAPPATDAERAYWQRRFTCSVREDCSRPDSDYLGYDPHPFERMITYSELPTTGGRPPKYMLNWPHHANDFPMNAAFFEDRYYRRRHIGAAKLHTLQYVTYMQSHLDHPEWRIAEDAYPTADHLPLIPYLRESRRLVNDRIMTQEDVVPVGDAPRAPWIPDSIAVGDYFIDHHHAEAQLPPLQRLIEDYPDNAPFQVPPAVFFPEEDERFLAGEKSIAVSHIVNGCTRLQPVVMLMGQALGVLAARAAQTGTPPAAVPVPAVQEALLEAGCQLFIMYDVPARHPLFRPVQELALAGTLRAEAPLHLKPEEPIPAAWARTWARRAGVADAVASEREEGPLQRAAVGNPLRTYLPEEAMVSRGAFVKALHQAGTTGG